eukprot:TRINITY_DN4920_c0_g1_i1.p1 TRINITY_DN4920_c0_g1~~TRINITY_DN4920_c0_g1_i1.p1  ORF type:complete len:353 (+),score=116.89 TRINITY_DN4920_c0_g1_i1:65-1123(+)
MSKTDGHLQCYRKRDPASSDEEEMVENLFTTLCSLLMLPSNRVRFHAVEGVQLMTLLVKKKMFCRSGALRVLDFTMQGEGLHERTFIDCSGLKTLFAAFMMKESTKKKKKKSKSKNKGRKREMSSQDEEHIIGCIAKLFLFYDANCNDSEDEMRYSRLVHKFCENQFEKVNRLVEMHAKYFELAVAATAAIELEKRQRAAQRDDYDPTEDEMEFLSQRLEAGMFTLHLTDVVIAFIATCPGEMAMRAHLSRVLYMQDVSLDGIISVLEDYYRTLESDDSEMSPQARAKERTVGQLLATLKTYFERSRGPANTPASLSPSPSPSPSLAHDGGEAAGPSNAAGVMCEEGDSVSD